MQPQENYIKKKKNQMGKHFLAPDLYYPIQSFFPNHFIKSIKLYIKQDIILKVRYLK